jgi:hypothetical protein
MDIVALGERALGTHRIEACVGPRADLGAVAKINVLDPTRNCNLAVTPSSVIIPGYPYI